MKKPLSNISSKFLKFIVVFLLLTVICYDHTEAAQETLPFTPGEKFIYNAKWWSIPVGEVSFEILPFETVNGTKAYHFVMKTKTNPTIDLFYRIRDREDSYVDANITHSLLYLKREISKHPRNVKVTYDWQKMTATRVNFAETSDPIAIVPGTFDPLAIFFVIRTKNLNPGDVLEIPTTVGTTYFVAKASIIGREEINVGDKVYDTFIIAPETERLEKAYKRNDKVAVKVWLTADDKKVPVKLECNLGVGRFVFEMVSSTF